MGLSKFVGTEKASGDAAIGGPQGDGGTAAASSPPSMLFKEVIPHSEGGGVCLCFDLDGVSRRENLSEGRVEQRIEDLKGANDDIGVAIWTWKLEQIQKAPAEG